MFNRKYVFETKSTRLKRIFLSSLAMMIVISGILTTFIIYIPVSARFEKEKSSGALFQKSPDMIAVFTGDKGRINYALDLLKKNPTTKLLISGVWANNSIETLIKHQTNNFQDFEAIEANVDLDYESKNTFQNVIETVSFINSESMIQNVLIISSDYHIMRIKLILNHLLPNTNVQFHYDGLKMDYSDWDNVRKLLKESLKITRTFILLKVFRNKTLSE